MTLSLDYLGKLTIILIVIAVSIGMIMEFRSQVENTTPTPGSDEDPGLEIVQVEETNSINKVASLITLCYERSLDQGYEDFSCFVARKDTGGFDIEASEIENHLEESVSDSTKFKASTYDRDSIIIQYDVNSDKVVVKK